MLFRRASLFLLDDIAKLVHPTFEMLPSSLKAHRCRSDSFEGPVVSVLPSAEAPSSSDKKGLNLSSYYCHKNIVVTKEQSAAKLIFKQYSPVFFHNSQLGEEESRS